MTANLPISPRIASITTVAKLPEAPELDHLQEGVIAELLPLGVVVNDHGCQVHVIITLEDEVNLLRFPATVDLAWLLDLMPARVLMRPPPENPGCLAHSGDLEFHQIKPVRRFVRQLLAKIDHPSHEMLEGFTNEASHLLTWWSQGGTPVRHTQRFVERLLTDPVPADVAAAGEQLVTDLRSIRRGQRPAVAVVNAAVSFLEVIIQGNCSQHGTRAES